jgi:hypothetical protein
LILSDFLQIKTIKTINLTTTTTSNDEK